MRADFALHPAPALTQPFTVPADGNPDRRPGRSKRSAGDRLREALVALGDHRGQVLAHQEKAWASITFAGARHTIDLLFAGEEAVAAGEALIAALSEHEFAIPGQLVADATVTEAEHRLLPTPRLAVTCEMLLLEEG